MTLIRATNASETMGRVSMLIAAYCQRTGMPMDTLASYLQIRQPPVPGTIPAGAGAGLGRAANPVGEGTIPAGAGAAVPQEPVLQRTGIIPARAESRPGWCRRRAR